LHAVINLERVGVFRVNPGPRLELGARNDLLPLRSIDQITGDDRRSWRGRRYLEAAGDVVPDRWFLGHVFVPLAEIEALDCVRTAAQYKDGKSQCPEYATSP
jgi:hypothetical protein